MQLAHKISNISSWSKQSLFLEEQHIMSASENQDGSFWDTRIVGDYDYSRLCMPRFNPWSKADQGSLPYYGKDSRLALLVALFLGFQHSLAVVGGTVLPGILIGAQDPSGKAASYLVSYA